MPGVQCTYVNLPPNSLYIFFTILHHVLSIHLIGTIQIFKIIIVPKTDTYIVANFVYLSLLF